MAADDPRSVVVHEIAPIGKLGEPPVMSLRLGPALVPVISICAVKAADGNKEDADEAAAKCVQRRGVQFAKSFPIPKQAAGKEITESPVSATHLGQLVGLIVKGELTGKLAKDVLPKMFESGEAPAAIVEREGLKTVNDTGALEKLVDEVIAASPKQVEQFKAGKTTVMGYLVGQAMKASRGQANPAVLNELFNGRLK